MSDDGNAHPEFSGLATKAIHAGYRPDPATGAVNTPIYASSTFAQDGVGALRGGYEYARTGNPTRAALEATLAAVEAGSHGRAFASGMAATDCALRAVLRPGDHVVIPNDAYGGTFRLIDKVFTRWNVEYTPVPLHQLDAVAAAITPRTRLIWVETPTNPLLSIADIAALAQLGHQHSAKVLVDNTFASPALQQPLTLGADIVLHSTTKYIGGHSDVVGGALVTNDAELDDAFGFLQNGAGAVPGPFDAYLTMRGLKTLVLRMQRHTENASAVAQFLAGHPAVSAVLYPGLPGHPGHDVAARQMSGFGGMVSVRMRGGRQAARKLCANTRVFILAESLGGVESLIEHPSAMTHASTAGSQLEVPDDLVRLSVGIEDVDDLLADLDRALS
ncbi:MULTISPECIES: cystathionine gamma-synthase [Mycobacterium avium complex (MAC)]|uniref:Cystathionine gamma-synthase n=10 Tax=Mycobacterium avium complex (MAC) TaxID=120793 RepID=Q741R1_MYCPA|nr:MULTISPECIES: cystathionine gamma-synthase [Mycobacterium avium complex (MAC)]ELP47144.1 cystathionine gamma-synthase [Mycobacterium avium subsp. paratuberculosis S5]ETA91748.1 cystathionine gamma-synthase [Mycobacterium avium 05-4293]ETB02528.1 cystathionine gamma-synthase [Mycobacterium avium subsp. paratuberculosis 10-5864]ETB15296.1 cystathionine gamma-synthase [Mycobacterium avium subsp. avium 10-9275]ETB19679.1 cystathionine gamma-synthase [Mycobacterium avium subsp. avium 11-4751]ET